MGTKNVVVGEAGKYDDSAEHVLRATTAKAVVLLVVDGFRGNGFSVSCRPSEAAEWADAKYVAAALRSLANEIDGATPDGVRLTYEEKGRGD